jgi:hypothetical protein
VIVKNYDDEQRKMNNKRSKNKPNSKPIQTQSKPILGQYQGWQSQTKPIQTQFSKAEFHKCVFNLTYINGLLNWIKSRRFVTNVQNCPYQYNKPAFIAVRFPYMRDSFNDREEILPCRLTVEHS